VIEHNITIYYIILRHSHRKFSFVVASHRHRIRCNDRSLYNGTGPIGTHGARQFARPAAARVPSRRPADQAAAAATPAPPTTPEPPTGHGRQVTARAPAGYHPCGTRRRRDVGHTVVFDVSGSDGPGVVQCFRKGNAARSYARCRRRRCRRRPSACRTASGGASCCPACSHFSPGC
jgi:hypothetical protein